MTDGHALAVLFASETEISASVRILDRVIAPSTGLSQAGGAGVAT